MWGNIEKLKIISVLRKVSKPFGNVLARGSDGINIRVSGRIFYNFSGKKVKVEAGEVIFIPKGTKYTYETTEGSICTTINIAGEFSEKEPYICSLKDFSELEFLSNNFSDLWKFGSLSDRCECVSKFYSLLAFVANNREMNYGDKKKLDLIEPAVEYLKSHIFSTTLKTEKLHLLCGISNTYFRELFYLRFKTTPKEYVTSRRLSHAKSIIDSGDYTSVKELATLVGYKDSLYFGKVFKKMYGNPPSAVVKE